MKTEIWKDIIGYEGLYMVSNLGRIKRLGFHRKGKFFESEKIKKFNYDKNGYCSIQLYKGIKKEYPRVHRLVYCTFNNITFKSESLKNNVVCHIDNDVKNNNLENLYLGTQKENIQQSVKERRHSSITRSCYKK